MPICSDCGRESDGDFAFCPHCGAALTKAPRSREQRKTVTVLFCDVTGSTALGESTDPEALRVLLARYFERMKGIVESHAGTVEKFIGDAVMAVFGVPQVREDDALRACRAAMEMCEALPELGVEARIGVNTGEVVTGTEERLATGDAVNVAARLEQAAQSGEILIGSDTLALVRDAVGTEPVTPLELKGKAELVPAHRLLEVREAPERSHDAPFVGRSRELALIHEAWKQVQAAQSCELVTVVGDAGVGKSRLTSEFLASVEAQAVNGRCLPYGEGITYWPVVEVLKQLDGLPSDPAAAASLRSLLGESDEGTSSDEIAWAFRMLLEERAPIVCFFDDLQWGAETFLDLVEQLAVLLNAPVMLLCLARPELVERRPEWPVFVRLEPLPAADADELIPASLIPEIRLKITGAAGGNPLFLTEMAAMAAHAGAEVLVPPNLQALLAARLDQLDTSERSVLERGAVEGEIFHRGSVQALSGDGIVASRLVGLVRKGLIRPDRATLPSDDAFRFRHLLVRDAAYEGLSKAIRADLHERFAAWLEERGADLAELDEILGFHLEQAARYRRELGREDEELATAARQRLTAAGRRSLGRLDFGSAARLLERAAELVPPPGVDLGLETDLIDALSWGARSDEAVARARSLAERSAAADDRVGQLCGRIHEAVLHISVKPADAADALEALVAEALPVFEAAGDELALRIAYRALGTVANMRAQMDQMVVACEQAEAHAAPAGGTALVGYQGHARFHGSTSATELLDWLDDQVPREQRTYWLRTYRLAALAMLGRIDEARGFLDELRAELVERGATRVLAAVQGYAMDIEILAGDPAAAVAAGEAGCRMLEELGHSSELSTVAARLARAYCDLGRLDEAERWVVRAAELGSSDDAFTQMHRRDARAIVLARQGEHAEAERLAREAVEIGEKTEALNSQGDTYVDLGEILTLAGRPDEAADALEQALERYERKKNLAMVAQVRPKLEALRQKMPT